MRTIELDQYEFPNGSNSEEFARISTHGRGKAPYSSVLDFARVANEDLEISGLPPARPFFEIGKREMERTYLALFAGIDLPAHCDYPTYLITDDWNECHLVIEGPEFFISFYWATSA
ncbi:hypothetical protein V8J88_05260 [Massilia sp. W12]|uniref:hypothetical protein n=1 Tax=Massilia sp. W12 TaxID=3126507 RepID=UPI0030CF79B8